LFPAVEVSSESEPEELDDISGIEDIKADDEDIQELEKLIATTKSMVFLGQHLTAFTPHFFSNLLMN
jgi:hypothetical protein